MRQDAQEVLRIRAAVNDGQGATMRTSVVTLLATMLAVGPLHAQQQPEFSLLRAARAEAVRQTPPATAATRPPMSQPVKWTGIGLVIGGGALLLSGILVDNACIDNGEHGLDFCQDLQTAWFATGAAVAGAGGVVLLVGRPSHASGPAPASVSKGVGWRIRF